MMHIKLKGEKRLEHAPNNLAVGSKDKKKSEGVHVTHVAYQCEGNEALIKFDLTMSSHFTIYNGM